MTKLINPLIRLNAGLCQVNHSLIQSLNIISQLVHAVGQRTHYTFQTRQTYFRIGLAIQQEFDSLFDIHALC